MATKKTITPHLDYLEDCLTLLKTKTTEAREYLNDVRWQDMGEAENREKEFKFQATLVDKYVVWLNEYAKLSGIIEAFNDMKQVEEKEVRKGSSRSAFAEMVKEGEFNDE